MASLTGSESPSAAAGVAPADIVAPAPETARRSDDRAGMAPKPARAVSPLRVKRAAAARRIREAAEEAASLETRDRLRRLAGLVRGGAGDARQAEFIETAIGECLEESASVPPADRWLACGAAAWALAWMARARRAGGSAGRLLERLVGAARTAGPMLADGDTLPARFVLTLARLFRDIEACDRLAPAACDAVVTELGRLTSPRGIVNLAGSAAMVDRVVRWTAFRETAVATGEAAWDEACERRWRKAALAAIRLLGRRGRQLVAGGLMPTQATARLLAAVAAGGGPEKRSVGRLLSGRSSKPGPKRLAARDLHDGDAAVAIMRSDWGGDALRVLVDYRRPVPHLEIAVGDRLLVDGPWQWSVTMAEGQLEAEGPWTVECWESDRRTTFLELAAPLPGGHRIERQVVLLAKERVVLLADAVITAAGRGCTPSANGRAGDATANGGGGDATPLRYASTLRLGTGLDADPAAETRELLVYDTRMRLLALPLALPEWRVGGGGRFEAGSAGLTLSQETAGPRLYAPPWLDCDPARIGRPLTWRQLTVADTRINLPPWQAAGFRVQEGLEQWLVYRSLDVARNRSLLGCNVSCDFLLGRITRQGEVKRVLEIQ